MRLIRHGFARSVRRVFPEAAMQRLTDAIVASERRHSGEIVFAVESGLPVRDVMSGMDASARAQEVFARLRVWDTEANNGVLIYLLLADHRIEIVADRGLDGRVNTEEWAGICDAIGIRIRDGQAEQAALQGISAVSELLERHFPAGTSNTNELPDRPVLL